VYFRSKDLSNAEASAKQSVALEPKRWGPTTLLAEIYTARASAEQAKAGLAVKLFGTRAPWKASPIPADCRSPPHVLHRHRTARTDSSCGQSRPYVSTLGGIVVHLDAAVDKHHERQSAFQCIVIALASSDFFNSFDMVAFSHFLLT
jgi:hypothetical protein